MIDNNKNNIETQKVSWSTVNPSQQNRDNKGTKISIFILVFIISVAILVFGAFKGLNYKNNKNVAVSGKESHENNKTGSKVETSEGEISGAEGSKDSNDNATYEFNDEELYKYIHKMTNTIIIPEDGEKIGAVIITKDSIEKALAETKNREPELYGEISNWLNLDFSNAVEVHNMVWTRLEGSIGRASSLDEEAIEIVTDRIEN